MRGFGLPFALLLLGVAVGPVATATGVCQSAGVAYACAGDWGTYTGCYNEGEFSSENTGVLLLTPVAAAQAGGSRSCSNFCFPIFGCYRSTSEGVFVTTSITGVGLTYAGWTGGSGCHMYVGQIGVTGFTYRDIGCPVGPPPDLPWGHVLP